MSQKPSATPDQEDLDLASLSAEEMAAHIQRRFKKWQESRDREDRTPPVIPLGARRTDGPKNRPVPGRDTTGTGAGFDLSKSSIPKIAAEIEQQLRDWERTVGELKGGDETIGHEQQVARETDVSPLPIAEPVDSLRSDLEAADTFLEEEQPEDSLATDTGQEEAADADTIPEGTDEPSREQPADDGEIFGEAAISRSDIDERKIEAETPTITPTEQPPLEAWPTPPFSERLEPTFSIPPIKTDTTDDSEAPPSEPRKDIRADLGLTTSGLRSEGPRQPYAWIPVEPPEERRLPKRSRVKSLLLGSLALMTIWLGAWAGIWTYLQLQDRGADSLVSSVPSGPMLSDARRTDQRPTEPDLSDPSLTMPTLSEPRDDLVEPLPEEAEPQTVARADAKEVDDKVDLSEAPPAAPATPTKEEIAAGKSAFEKLLQSVVESAPIMAPPPEPELQQPEPGKPQAKQVLEAPVKKPQADQSASTGESTDSAWLKPKPFEPSKSKAQVVQPSGEGAAWLKVIPFDPRQVAKMLGVEGQNPAPVARGNNR